MLLLRQIQDDTGGFTEFVPLGVVHRNTLLFHQGVARAGPTLAEHLAVHALARLLLAGSINNIQVSWVKLNRHLSQLCLRAGANDYGGTLMEENISREAGATAGQYTSPEDFQALILEAGAGKRFDRLVVVTCNEEQRVARFAARQKIDLEAARKEVVRRMAAQLPDEEKIKASELAKAAGADFVKTSTGFGPGGATAHDVALMRKVVGPNIGVKAAGGVKDLKSVDEMVAAGATRIGASAGVKIMQEVSGSNQSSVVSSQKSPY